MSFKAFAKKHPVRLAVYVFLLISFAILHMFSTWQTDLICVGPVWSYGWCHPQGRYADDPFQCWIWKTTIGSAYDTLFFLNFLSFYAAIAICCLLFYDVLRTKK